MWDELAAQLVPNIAAAAASAAAKAAGTAVAQLLGTDLLYKKFVPQLDSKASEDFHNLGPTDRRELLEDLENKGAGVRNISAYVSRACRNRESQDLGRAVGLDVGSLTTGGSSGSNALLDANAMGAVTMAAANAAEQSLLQRLSLQQMQLPPSLDTEAQEALRRAGPEHAEVILRTLQQKQGSIRNPSAYVCRSVANLGLPPEPGTQEGPRQPLAAPAASKSVRMAITPQMLTESQFSLMQIIDVEARGALEGCEPEVVAQIMSTLEQNLERVHNPSAWVLKSVANAKRGSRQPAQLQAMHSGVYMQQAVQARPAQGPWDQGPGLQAQQACYGANGAPMQQLQQARLSAPTMPASGPPMGQAPNRTLDIEAIKALQDVDPKVAQSILADVHMKGDQIRNPSAYVIRAVVNAKSGLLPHGLASGGQHQPPQDLSQQVAPGPMAPLGPLAAPGTVVPQQEAPASNWSDAVLNDEFHMELQKLPYILDDKAIGVLLELDTIPATEIVRNLSTQGAKIKNPNAWIMRAVANKQRDESANKRQRIM